MFLDQGFFRQLKTQCDEPKESCSNSDLFRRDDHDLPEDGMQYIKMVVTSKPVKLW